MMDDDVPKFVPVEPNREVRKLVARIAVVEHFYHQQSGQQPEDVTTKFGRDLKNDEQFYRRRFSVKEEWQAIETGWITECALMLLENEAPKFLSVPTPEAKELEFSKIVELRIGDAMIARIRPGESMRMEPIQKLDQFYLRSQVGRAFCNLTLVSGAEEHGE